MDPLKPPYLALHMALARDAHLLAPRRLPLILLP
jgi:hypothetical protein